VNNGKTVIYFPDKLSKQSYISLFKDMFSEIVNSRWLTYQLLRRNFTGTYKQSLLGVLWALVTPLASVALFIFLNRGGILNVGVISVPYPLFATAGTALWQFFAVGLTLSTNSLSTAGSLISKVNFTRKSLVISAAAQGFITSLIPLALALILFVPFSVVPPLTIFLVPLAMIPLLLLTLGLAFICSLVNGVLRDIGNGISVIITFLMFATPILYARPDTGIVATVSKYNPLYYLISVPRDLFIFGRVEELSGFAYSSLFSLVVFLVFLMVFHLSETKVVERI
jgi:lipopolysaccharide transport system permease protein